MRVVQLMTQDRGGPVDHAVELAIELARQGHDSHLVGPAGPHLARAAAHDVTTHVATVGSAGDVRGARAVLQVLGAVRPDVLHLQDRRAGLVGRALAASRGLPSVYTLHGVPDQLAHLVPGNLAMTSWRRRDRMRYLHGERLLARAPRSAVVTPCEALAAYARDHVGVDAARVRAVPNGVGHRWLDRSPETDAVRRTGRTGADRSAPLRVTWLGVMQPVKRLPDLVSAVDRVEGVRLRLVGDGPCRPEIEARIATAEHPSRMSCIGFHDDPAPLLRQSDVLALSSAAEACPMAILQAMAAGVPVVATRVGGVPEVVRDGIDGLLVAPGDVDGLARALAALATDPALRRRMGEHARRRVLDRYVISHTARALSAVYEEVTG